MKTKIFVAVIGLTAITWYCGFMFKCGCNWPWEGLYFYCNIHDPHALHQCPWCKWKIAGALSVMLSIWAGWKASSPSQNQNPANIAIHIRLPENAIRLNNNAVSRIVAGIIAMFVMATVCGWLFGYLQNYPYFWW